MIGAKARSSIKDEGLERDWMTFSRANTVSTETQPEEGNQNYGILLSDDAFSSNGSPDLKSAQQYVTDRHFRGKLNIKEMLLSNKLGMNPFGAL